MKNLAILGAGNIGTAIAKGLIQSGNFEAKQITLTRRKIHLLDPFKQQGFEIHKSNVGAVKNSEVILIAVEPKQLDSLLKEISQAMIPGKHTLISVVSGVGIGQIKKQLSKNIKVVRAMPNTAIAIRESMTCLATDSSDTEAI